MYVVPTERVLVTEKNVSWVEQFQGHGEKYTPYLGLLSGLIDFENAHLEMQFLVSTEA